MQRVKTTITLLLLTSLLTGCAYNPFIANNRTTGSPVGAAVGAGIGAGGMALLGGTRPYIAGAGVVGGIIGYYVTTLRYHAGGIYRTGGQVYQIGDYTGIYIPTDNLFEPNTADFLPQAKPILDSVVTVLERTPDYNIIISGNTSGFYRSRWEQQLSERRAERVAAYLWSEGISDFKKESIETRKLNYVGYGDYFPIAASRTNHEIRQNSRIQITVYPSDCDLHLDKRHLAVHNIGIDMDDEINNASTARCDAKGDCASE